ncbi:hypothetical protein BV25DRAFT_1843458 [Artomyces pyxidatus]|uniref:Uncharacterized protein n=1 Tax=Artomyces pyxidatus TaxID=48021 RepID=A0ACB8SES1_9AGAM|nr:hypothetical protein BV25DRAFT_1843458 [Artomyces pyxidatus]
MPTPAPSMPSRNTESGLGSSSRSRTLANARARESDSDGRSRAPKRPAWVVYIGLQPGVYFTEREKNQAVEGVADRWWELFDDADEAERVFREAEVLGDLRAVEPPEVDSSGASERARTAASAPILPLSSAAASNGESVDQSQAPPAFAADEGPSQPNGGNRNRNVAWVVFRGKKPGIYRTWDEAQMQLRGVSNHAHNAYRSWAVAMADYEDARRAGRLRAL